MIAALIVSFLVGAGALAVTAAMIGREAMARDARDRAVEARNSAQLNAYQLAQLLEKEQREHANLLRRRSRRVAGTTDSRETGNG